MKIDCFGHMIVWERHNFFSVPSSTFVSFTTLSLCNILLILQFLPAERSWSPKECLCETERWIVWCDFSCIITSKYTLFEVTVILRFRIFLHYFWMHFTISIFNEKIIIMLAFNWNLCYFSLIYTIFRTLKSLLIFKLVYLYRC